MGRCNGPERSLNDWTPLHFAAGTEGVEGIELLCAHGADPNARTRIDDGATPLEQAERLGRAAAVRAVRDLTSA